MKIQLQTFFYFITVTLSIHSECQELNRSQKNSLLNGIDKIVFALHLFKPNSEMSSSHFTKLFSDKILIPNDLYPEFDKDSIFYCNLTYTPKQYFQKSAEVLKRESFTKYKNDSWNSLHPDRIDYRRQRTSVQFEKSTKFSIGNSKEITTNSKKPCCFRLRNYLGR